DRLRESSLRMHSRRESARGDELINVAAHPLQQARVTPQLRRTFGQERTLETLRLITGLFVELVEHVCWADQPVLVSRVHLHRTALVRFQSKGCRSQQRRVMEMDHVVGFTVEHLSNPLPLEEGASRLLREQR